MRQTLLSSLLKGVLFSSMLVTATTTMAQSNKVPSFPGAQGYGMYVTGGRGGSLSCHHTRRYRRGRVFPMGV